MVRQASSQGQLLAFLVLDSAKDSILDLQVHPQCTTTGGVPLPCTVLYSTVLYVLLISPVLASRPLHSRHRMLGRVAPPRFGCCPPPSHGVVCGGSPSRSPAVHQCLPST